MSFGVFHRICSFYILGRNNDEQNSSCLCSDYSIRNQLEFFENLLQLFLYLF